MKRIILLLILVFSISAAYAQKGKVTAADSYLTTNDLDNAKKAIDAALANEKSNTWPKTYIVAAKVYTELYKNGKDDQGIMKAYDFYQKAIELDLKGDEKGKKKGKYKKDILFALTFFTQDLTNAAIEAFNKEDYETSYKAFDAVLKLEDAINKLEGLKPEDATVDTTIIYNCALAAYNAKDWKDAENYFKKTIELGYGGGDAVLLLTQVYSNMGDSAKMGETLKMGFEKYPEDERVLTSLIQYYISTEQNDAALEYLNKAIEKDPENARYYMARGVLYESIDKEKSIENYKKAIEIDPKMFDALYNIGVIYYNKGVEEQNKANEMSDYKEFQKAKKMAEGYWEKALPYLEKALEINPNDRNVLESLKGLYYRFDRMDKYNEMKARIEALDNSSSSN
ncbi:MAG: tetratricopeptide repeat protein [Chlorobi bacterium]|nr:tetratricopeptide repeat protein [Chlorobiota bacterium]